MTPAASPAGPVAQSLQIAFRGLLFGVLLLAGFWGGSNIRQVPSDAQAAVLRFGRVVRVQPAGLLLAWPRPIERVELLPAPARQMELKVVARRQAGGPGLGRRPADVPPASAGGYLTGDGGEVLLDATLTWRIADPVAYLLARKHVPAALQRLFVAGATAVAAARSIDDFMAVRAVGGDDPLVEAQRQAVRGDLVRAVNQRLAALAEAGAGLGVEVTRADVDALLPLAAKPGFDAVLEATQLAEQTLASARTDAARTLQAADRQRDRVLSAAHAAAAERVGEAGSQVAAVAALAGRTVPEGRPGLLEQIWRERVATVLRQAGSVVAVDPAAGTAIILPASP
jgi:regulator of protease activity HflC (stomatin/prohibitin superfamily)